jgi:hypothetical protein
MLLQHTDDLFLGSRRKFPARVPFQDQIVTSRLGREIMKASARQAGPEHQIIYRLHRSPTTEMRIHSIDKLEFIVDLRRLRLVGEL